MHKQYENFSKLSKKDISEKVMSQLRELLIDEMMSDPYKEFGYDIRLEGPNSIYVYISTTHETFEITGDTFVVDDIVRTFLEAQS